MKRTIATVSLLAMLASCGADGEPTPPSSVAKTGVTISGTARIGVAGKL